MIINTSTIFLTLLLVVVFLYGGLQLVRKFAYEIAMENHEAVTALDNAAQAERLRKERAADEQAAAAYAKVQPLLHTKLTQPSTVRSNNNNNNKPSHLNTSSKSPLVTPQGSPNRSPVSAGSGEENV
eukprot:CAMPEP_0168758786 /NCGR_PEP_ID=MMETSP0724-20121128/21885_1 /TAXON_ID=265536 /ORGANISM="Amphiprora sp., Strain CCMP467" /LENGTH=126 /DNA_ID=CAMNT_0008807685 /DNA_START=158 /DNA_END=538 /DNA_ORIENTATION=+